jgi:glyoxylase-like metal-dependent hydrolase (beta-lactamase superfamily II)
LKLYFHYCSSSFSNCYVLGTDSPETNPSIDASKDAPNSNKALIIDPGSMDSNLLSLIEENNYSLLGVLITHDHPHHVRGLKTIMKIYDTAIYALAPIVGEHRTTLVRDGDIFDIGPFRTEVFSIPGHSPDSAVFKIGRLLFTGDAMSAGFMGSTASSFSGTTQVNALRKKIFSLPGDYSILPGHGPPSSLEAERRFNLDINTFEQRKSRRSPFRFELD